VYTVNKQTQRVVYEGKSSNLPAKSSMDPILPAKIKKYLKCQIEQAIQENLR